MKRLFLIMIMIMFLIPNVFAGEKADVCHIKTQKTHSVSINAVDALVVNGNFTEGACGTVEIDCPCWTIEELNIDFATVMQLPYAQNLGGDEQIDIWGTGSYQYATNIRVDGWYNTYLAIVQKGNPYIPGTPQNSCQYNVDVDGDGYPEKNKIIDNISDDECELCKDLMLASDAW